jgi:O-methyltransferase domain
VLSLQRVHRLLRALSGLDVVSVDGDRYALTSLGRSLCPGPHSAAESAIFLGSPAVWSAWGALGDAVFDGHAAFRHAHGIGIFDYLAEHPDGLVAFQALMSAQSRLQIPAVLAAYDFTSAHAIVDVGGGQGALLAALLAANPTARGVLFDHPDVVARSDAVLAPVASRCEVVPGDFFQTVPAGADTYVLKLVLHDWDDACAARILHNVRDAIISDGHLIIIETVMPPGNEYHHAKFLDMNMLVLSEGGRERTEEEYRILLDEAGFTLSRVVPTASPMSLVEAIPKISA